MTQRTHEIGIRMALGAARSDVLRLVISRGMMPVLAGLAAGLAGAIAVSHLIGALLFRVSPTDPWMLGAFTAVLAGAALAACYLPALPRRCTATSPASRRRASARPALAPKM